MKLFFILFSTILFCCSLLTSATKDPVADDEIEIVAEDEPRNESELNPNIDLEEFHRNDNALSDSDSDPNRAESVPSTSYASAARGADGASASTATPKKVDANERWRKTSQKIKILYGMRRKHEYVRNLYKSDKYNMPKIWGGVVMRVNGPIQTSGYHDNDATDGNDKDAADSEEDRFGYVTEREFELKKIKEQEKSRIAEQKDHPQNEGTASKSSKKSTNKSTASGSKSIKRSSTKPSTRRKRQAGGLKPKLTQLLYSKQKKPKLTQLLYSKQKLMTVIMQYVELKLRDMSEQYNKFIDQVNAWDDNVKTVKDAFAGKPGYDKYEKLTFDWPKNSTEELNWPDDETTELNWPKDKEPKKLTLKEYHLTKLRQMANKYKEFKQLVYKWPDTGCFITFPMETNIFNKVFLFDHALKLNVDDLKAELDSGLFTHAEIHKDSPNDFFKDKEWSQKLQDDKETEKEDDDDEDDDDENDDDDDDDDDEDDENVVRMGSNALLQAILYGRAAFGQNAKLDLANLPKIAQKKKKSRVQIALEFIQMRFKMAKKIIKKLYRLLMWSLRAFNIWWKKMYRKAHRKLNKDSETKEEDFEFENYYKAMGKLRKEFDKEMAKKEKSDSQEQQKTKQTEDEFDHSPQKQMTEEDKFPHPFDFLAGVRYDIHVKPAEESFDQLYPKQYEELMEYYKDPKQFYEAKRLDIETIYVMSKFLESKKHLSKLYRKPYSLIREFFKDPVVFYQRGHKLDRNMTKAYANTMKERKNPLPKSLKSKNFASETTMLRFGYPSIPNIVFGSIEQLHDEALKAVQKVFAENGSVIQYRLSKRKNNAKKANAKKDDLDDFEKLSSFINNPVENYNLLDLKVFQIFREVVEVSYNDKDSNEELAHLSEEEYQQLLLFLENPTEFLQEKDNNKHFITVIMTVQTVVMEKKREMFEQITPEQSDKLKAFLAWAQTVQNVAMDKKEELEFNEALDQGIFSNYRQSLPAKQGIDERIKRFFTGSKLDFVFGEFKNEHQFDQLMRFMKKPDQFYQQLKISDSDLEEYREQLKKLLADDNRDSALAHLSSEAYKELIKLVENPNPNAQREGEKSDTPPAPDHIFKEAFEEYTKPLARNESCAKVKKFIELALYSTEDKQQMSTELRGRLGAQIISSVFNAKEFGGTMIFAMFLSLVGSGGIAIGLDMGLWHLILHLLGNSHPAVSIAVSIILDSLTPLFAETFDSFVIKRTLGAMEGKSFLPRTWKQFKEDMKESILSGGIAALGSIPNNIVLSLLPGSKYIHGNGGAFFGVFTLNAFTNQIAASTSAAMVPIQVENWHRQRSAAFYKLLSQGFFAEPTESKLLYGTVNAKTIAGYCRINAMDAMQIDSVVSMAFNSMGIGSVISFFFGFVAIYIPAALGVLNDKWQRVVSIMFNTPTEILSLGAGLLTANHLGNQWAQRWMSTDTHKNKQMVQLIFERTIAQLEHPEREIKDIEYEEVYKIYHARFQLTYRMGRGIVNLMLGMKNGIANLMLGIKNSIVNLFKRKPPTIDQLDEQFIDKEIMVQNWKPGVAYLVQFPRTDSAPSLSPDAIKLETWLRMENIPTYTVSDGVLFRALFSYDQSKVPFVEYNGQKIFGNIDEIIEILKFLVNRRRPFGEYVPKIEEDKPTNAMIDQMHRILLVDRTLNLERQDSKTHLLHGKDFQHFVIPSLLKEAKRNAYKILPLPMPFWRKYFGNDGQVTQGIASWNGHGLSRKQWNEFLDKVRDTHIPNALEKFRTLLLNQLNRLSLAPVSIMKEIKQIEDQLYMDTKNNWCISNKKRTVLDASLFGILAQFSYMGTIFNERVNNKIMNLLNDSTSKLGQYFAQMKTIFIGNNGKKFDQNTWPINAEWNFDPTEDKYNGPFMLRFDTMKLQSTDRIRFTDEQRKSFWPLLSVNSSKSAARLADTLFSEGNFLALYPKVVTFIVSYLLRFFKLEEYVKEMAHFSVIVELKQDCIKFELDEFKNEIVTKIEAFETKDEEDSTKNDNELRLKGQQICRALIHLVAAYLCQGNINENDCTNVHNEMAEKYLAVIFIKSETNFSQLYLAVRKYVYHMMTVVNVEYQTSESLKMFAAAMLDEDEEQSIKKEAKRLYKIFDHLEEYGNKRMKQHVPQQQQQALVQTDTDLYVLRIWVLRTNIVEQMRYLITALNDDETFAKNTVTFKDFELAHTHWLNLNILIKKYKDEAGEDKYMDKADMNSGYFSISDRKKNHLIKQLRNKTKELFKSSSINSEKKYHKELSHGLGQVRKLYEIRKSQLPKDEAINQKAFKEQYEIKKKEMMDKLCQDSTDLVMEIEEGLAEDIDVLSDIKFTLKRQSIKREADKIRADIDQMSKVIAKRVNKLKKLSSKELAGTKRDEVDALVCQDFLLQEMLNLTNSLDDKKFETDNYSFSDFKKAYFSGELLKWLYTKMKHSGSKLSQSQIDKGFNYVKDRRSTHHWHNTRATLFDWNSPVLLDFPALFDWVVKLKEKHFLKLLAWRFGQLIKLYMLRKENISDINSKSYSEKEEQQKELDDDNTKTALFLNSTKAIIWKKKREELAKEFSTELGNLDKKMKDTANKIIIEATGKDIDDAKVEIPMPLEEAEL